MITLFNYADGVKNHFFIGRLFFNKSNIKVEYYNKGNWEESGEVFYGKRSVDSKLKEIDICFI